MEVEIRAQRPVSPRPRPRYAASVTRPGLLLSLATPACGPASSTGPPPPEPEPRPATAPPQEPVADSFEATVEIDAQPGGKKEQCVRLVRDDGERWIVAYRPEPWLQPFARKRVRVTGERYTPQGQAIMAPHYRLRTIELLESQRMRSDALLARAGEEQTLTGVFSEKVGEPGTKLAGEPYTVFTTADGRTYLLANTPDSPRPGQSQTIRAREVEYSPYVARRSGPTLWVLAID